MARFLELLKSLIPTLENFTAGSSALPVGGPGWLLGALGTVAASVFGLSIGRTKAVISLFSIYVALLIEKLFPYFEETANFLGDSLEEHWLRLGLFAAFYIISFTIFSLSFIRKRLSSGEYSLFGILIISFLQFGFLASIVLNIIPRDLVAGRLSDFYNYFATSKALFLWAVTPIVVLIFVRK